MNRQIEFRGKSLEGEWVCGDYFKTPLTDESTNSKPEDGWFFLTDKVRHCISDNGCVYEVDPQTVGQFAEIKDYCEGDIIRWYELDFEYIGEIYFEDGIFCVRDDIEEDRVLYWIDRDFKTEIIGNTTDNPGLLEYEGEE